MEAVVNKLVPILIWLLGAAVPAVAQVQKVEVAPGVSVTCKTYPVPANEAPFFNFIEKNEHHREADRKLVANVLKVVPDRSKAAGAANAAGTKALLKEGDAATAAKRFNQAYLLDPQQSGIYHGFAMVVATRFEDFDYADELFRVAAHMTAPASTLRADHGRMLLIAGRAAAAKPLLEQAVKDTPDWAVPRMNLVLAAWLTGARAEACRFVVEVKGRELENVEADLVLFKQEANC